VDQVSAVTRYLIATFVNDQVLYAAMRASFEAAGFVEPVVRYTVESGDPYEAITRLGGSETPYVILVHQDVFADQGHDVVQLDAALDELTALDPSWAVAGNAGGAATGELIRHINDKWGAGWRQDLPQRVATLDENFLVLRTCRRPRCTPGLSGFHLYGADVCLNAAARGSSCYVVDFRVRHAGRGDTSGFATAAERLGEAWGRVSRRPYVVYTTMGPLPIARWRWQRGLLRRQGVPAIAADSLRVLAAASDRRRGDVQSRATRLLRGLANVAEARGARRQLRRAPSGEPDAYAFIEAFHYGLIRPTPPGTRAEMLQFLDRLRADPPCNIVQLGTGRGGGLFLLARAADPRAVIVSVDVRAASDAEASYPRSWGRLFQAFGRDRQTIHLIRGDDALPRVRSLVDERTVDVLFIDAPDSYDRLRTLFNGYRGVVRKGGIVAVHGIVSGDDDPDGGAPRFWRELVSAGAESEEIVDTSDRGAHGIGLVRLD
jgi:predicted O-methyltransferase YrrM